MSSQRLKELLDQSWLMPEGDEKITVLLEAVQVADTLGDPEQSFEVRQDLMEAANAWGRPEHELVAFAWCLAKLDAMPEVFEDWSHGMLWTYKRILGTLQAFPHIKQVQIESAFADFKQRLETAGYSLGTYHYSALRYAFHLGDTEKIEAHYALWKKYKPQDLDCEACWKHLEVYYHLYKNQLEIALEKADRLFLRGAPNCNRIPHSTHALILEPLLKLGLPEAALSHHQEFKKVAKDEGFAGVASQNMAYLAYAGQTTKALKLLEKYVPWAFKSLDLERRFDVLRGVLPVLERLKQKGVKTVQLRWNHDNPLYQNKPEHDLASLEQAILEEMQRVAALFDARNQNTHFAQRIGFDHELLVQY